MSLQPFSELVPVRAVIFSNAASPETLIGGSLYLVRAIETCFIGDAMTRMTEEDLNALRAAAATLEHPGLAARLGNIAGKPIELVSRALPEAASNAIGGATTKALEAALLGADGRIAPAA